MKKRSLALFLSISLLAVQLFGESATAAENGTALKDRFPVYSSEVSAEKVYYSDYLATLSEEQKNTCPDLTIPVDLSHAVLSVPGALEEVDDKTVINWKDSALENVKIPFEVPQAGMYRLEIDYTAISGSVDAPRRRLQLDDAVPFFELNNLVFNRKWVDANKPKTNSRGDKIRPRQEELLEEQTFTVEDAQGRYEEPFAIYLTQGTHTLGFTYLNEYLTISGIRFVPVPTLSSYEQQLQEWRAQGYTEATEQIKINAEDCLYKSASSIHLAYSNDPAADPPSKGFTVLNGVGGASWNQGNQVVAWEFDVTESGLYALDFRAYQKYNDGLSSYRQILIDGEIPFSEFACYEFRYSDWDTVRAATPEGKPYLIYLSAGRHEIALKNKTSAYAEILYEMEKVLELYAHSLQNIIMITGISPDVNFDYQFFEKLPWLKEELQEISSGLEVQIQKLTESLERTPGPVGSLKSIQFRIDKLIEDPLQIAGNVSYLIDEQTTLSSWIQGFNNLPLMLDYLLLSPPAQPVEEKHSNFFEKAWFFVRELFLSFIIDDYKDLAENQPKKLSVWLARGQEWGEALEQLTSDDFTAQTNIEVDFNLLPAGQLGTGGVMLLSVASGTAPDLALGVDSTVPAEYGMRGRLVDLKQMPGFAEVESRFLNEVTVPYRFKDALYALPETMDFSVMYYRTDVLNSLGVKAPDTWEDLYNLVLPALKRKGMDFWYEGGINSFLYQQGGAFYTADGLKSGLDTPEAFEAFQQFSNLYLMYGVPVAANFYTRFRAGQMPIGISGFNTYLLLTSAAQELDGKWTASTIPGTKKPDGSIDRSNSVASTCSMIFNNSGKVDEAWKFLEWYTRAEVQSRYAGDLVAHIGPEAKWCSANIEAFDSMSWDNNFKAVITEQRKWCRGVPSVVGGYITARHVENARVRTVINKMNAKESIERAAKDINRELAIKNEEFAKRAKTEKK